MVRDVQQVVHATSEVISKVAAAFSPVVQVREEGRVRSLGDGVLTITGLPNVAAEELLAVGEHARAVTLGLAPGVIRAALLDASWLVRAGARVRALGRTVSIPVGPALLGRVVDALGQPLDGQPLRGNLQPVPVERTAPQIHQRMEVHTPLYTGILALDAMFPMGLGQRELVLGDEGTGKTSLALDALLRQRNTGVIGVYVAIGRRRSEVWQVADALRANGGQWVVVAAPGDATPGMRYLAPYAGTAVAEYFAYRGEHTLVVYDDLTAHAVAWRELSLLLHRPPGREAFPGDIFYLHSRLLERAAQLSVDLGGGSLTALPLAVLESGRLTGYIPTNLISITDGQVVLSSALFAAGQRPAIHAGLSVSRVGARAQPQALRTLAARMRLDYASFLELEAFARLGTRMEAGTRKRVDVGQRIRALLRAPRGQPLSVMDEVVRLALAGQTDLLLTMTPETVEARAPELAMAVAAKLPGVALRVETDGVLSEQDHKAICSALGQAMGWEGGHG